MIDNKSEYVFYKGNNPLWKYSGSESFEDLYEVIVDHHFDARDKDIQPIYVPSVKPADQACCICRRNFPDVSFNSVSHIIPACLGNRVFFSLIECDHCNKRYGLDYENHLANMTEPQRAVFQIPTRGRPPKWTYRGGTSQFSFDRDHGIVMQSGGSADAVQVEFDLHQKQILIEGPIRSYKPVMAIKSMLHSAWLFMPDFLQEKHFYLLEILEERVQCYPFQYLLGHIPDRPHAVVHFQVFQKQASVRSKVPEVVVQMYIGNTLIIWSSPTIRVKSYDPFPLPLIKAQKKAPPPHLQIINVPTLHTTYKNKTAKMTFIFDRVEEMSVGGNGQLTKNLRFTKKAKSKSVRIVLQTNSRRVEMGGLYMKFKNVSTSSPIVVISGRSLPMRLIISLQGSNKSNKANLTYTFQLAGKQISEVAKALQFTDELLNPDCEIEIIEESGSPIFTFGKLGKPPRNLAFEQELVARMQIIEEKCKTKLRYPEHIDDLKWLDLLRLCNLVNEEMNMNERGDIEFTVKTETVEELVSKLEDGEAEISMTLSPQKSTIFGQNVETPAVKICPQKIKVSKVTQLLNGESTINGTYEGLNYILL